MVRFNEKLVLTRGEKKEKENIKCKKERGEKERERWREERN